MARLPKEEYIKQIVADIDKAENDLYYAENVVEVAERELRSAKQSKSNVANSLQALKDQYFYITGEEYDG
jgi:hypothetical protein